MSRNPVDFSYIKPEHKAVDERLHNWARCVRDTPPSKTHPMFSQYRSPEHWGDGHASVPIDTIDGRKVETLVSRLAAGPRVAIRWWYVFGYPPYRVAKAQGVTLTELADLVHSGRELLRSK